MSTLRVEGIRNAAASSDAITLATDGTCTAKVTNNLSNRNILINGAMNVAQRGTSDTSNGYFTTVDRWNCTVNGLEENVTRSQESLSTSDTGPYEKGFRNAWKFVNGNQTGGADAGGYIIPQYAIEAQDLANSGWNYKSASSYITLSFWVKSSVAQTFYGFFRTIAGTDQAYSFSYALSANTWTKVTKTIPGLASGNIDINDDNTNGMSLFLPLFMGTDRTTSGHTLNTWAAYSGSNRTPDQTTTWYTTNDATWHLTGVQLEVGSVATPFEHRSYSEELDRCKRYYQVIATDIYDPICTGAAFAGDMVHGTVQFQKQFRDEPSMVKAGGSNWLSFRTSYYNNGANNHIEGDDFDLQQVSEQGANIRFTGFSFGSNVYMGAGGPLYTQNASALLAFSAEL